MCIGIIRDCFIYPYSSEIWKPYLQNDAHDCYFLTYGWQNLEWDANVDRDVFVVIWWKADFMDGWSMAGRKMQWKHAFDMGISENAALWKTFKHWFTLWIWSIKSNIEFLRSCSKTLHYFCRFTNLLWNNMRLWWPRMMGEKFVAVIQPYVNCEIKTI